MNHCFLPYRAHPITQKSIYSRIINNIKKNKWDIRISQHERNIKEREKGINSSVLMYLSEIQLEG